MIPTRSASSAGSSSAASRKARTSAASSSPQPPRIARPCADAVARGAARVALHDRVAGRDVGLRLVEQRPAVLGERAAVDRQQHRVRPGPGRRGHPAVHRVAVRRRRRPLAHPVHAGRSRRAARPKRGEQPAPPRGERDQLAGGPVVRHDGDDDPAAGRDAAHGERPVDQHLGRAAVERHPQQLHRARAAHPDQHGAVGHDGRRRLVARGGAASGSSSGSQRPPSASDPAGHGLPGDEVERRRARGRGRR